MVQQHTASKQIVLPQAIRTGKMEFSSMAWAGNRLLLVPQYPERFNNKIYSLQDTAIGNALRLHRGLTAFATLNMLYLDVVKKHIGSTYEGFEATTVLGNRIFFSIETAASNANCILVGGSINGNTIELDTTRLLKLPKLKRLSNAGYEGLAWLPGKNKLAAFFEYNKTDAGPRAWLIDTSLLKKPQSIPLNPLMFRITDVTAAGRNRLLGINFYYNGKTEFSEYIGADSNRVIKDMHGKRPRETCYGRIIELNARKSRITWKEKRSISFECSNWEGIAPFMGGVLIITDEHPESVLEWLKL